MIKEKKKRKIRSDKNKKRKHEHRDKTDGVTIDQRLLLKTPIETLVWNIEMLDSDVGEIEKIMPDPPAFDRSKDYYKEYYRLYLKNENLLADIDQTATESLRMERKILNIKDFYDNTLIPQMLT